MSSTRTETAPGTWDDARDVPFFTLTARLFAPASSASEPTQLIA